MKKKFRALFLLLIFVFVLMNVVAAFQAYKFTHFADASKIKTKNAKLLSNSEKIKAIMFGVENPRPITTTYPNLPYKTIKLKSNKTIECWQITADSSKGTIVLCHGYSADKSTMLDKAYEFLKLGYSVLLVDFMGSGGSEGNQTTIGFKEADEVATCYTFLKQQGEKKIFLFGTSMGAVAIIKCINDHDIKPAGILVECPFGTMYKTTCSRFRTLHIPTFPMAGLLDIWGGIENGFSPFSFSPIKYAKKIHCPTLLMYGEQDEKVSSAEIDDIFANLQGPKMLKKYPLAGHDNYLLRYKQQWIADVRTFLNTIK